MRTNTAAQNYHGQTHEGASARRIGTHEELQRSVMACLLWEREFYEDGEQIGARIARLAAQSDPQFVADLAIRARGEFRLRHVPLLLVRELARHPRHPGSLVGKTLSQVIQRADELAEFLAIYWKEKRQPISKQVKMGLATAFRKFDAYQLAKYNRDGAVKLRDVLFMCHARPKDEAQAAVWEQLVDGTLPTPDTWETSLSAGEDKREAFERLLRERKLGYMALLRNLRNMLDAGVDEKPIVLALAEGAVRSKALPFRFISAARAAPKLERALDHAMQLTLAQMPKLPGKTVVLMDVSGSMTFGLSGKSGLTHMDAGCALAALVAGIAEECEIFSFSNELVSIPPRQGMALVDAIQNSQRNAGTWLGKAVASVNPMGFDRLIVFTDEQSHDAVPGPNGKGYMVNVASARRGVGYGPWVHIDGFSEAIVRYIQETEGLIE